MEAFLVPQTGFYQDTYNSPLSFWFTCLPLHGCPEIPWTMTNLVLLIFDPPLTNTMSHCIVLTSSEWVNLLFSHPRDCSHTCVLSHFSCVQVFATLWTVAHQAPLSMGLSRQEYWSGLPCYPPEIVQHCSSRATGLYDLFILHQFLPGYPLTLQPHLQQEPQIRVLISLYLINRSFFLFSDGPANHFQWWDQVGSCISKPKVQGLVRIIGWAAWGRSDGLVLWLKASESSFQGGRLQMLPMKIHRAFMIFFFLCTLKHEAWGKFGWVQSWRPVPTLPP